LKSLPANIYLPVNRWLEYTRRRQVWAASEGSTRIAARAEELMTGGYDVR
jgi:hypothetical protein